MDASKRDDDKLVFSDDIASERSLKPVAEKQKKLLIVDDEKEVHVMTKLVLSDYIFDGYSLQFFSAFSSDEAKDLIKAHPDAACILLDVVMESEDAGLEIARYIREDENNSMMRIILRTGQPGKAPEKDVILNYDINDYKEKTELTTQKLFTCITTALRSYTHLLELSEKRKEISLKNERLNEEIAKRIVAEHNLTKYNRSLEKILENKTARLRESLIELEIKRDELRQTNFMASLGEVSSAKLSDIDTSSELLSENLEIINTYQAEMVNLLDKYQMLQNIIQSHTDCTTADFIKAAQKSVEELEEFKKKVDYGTILEKYPEIIADSSKGIHSIAAAVKDIKLFLTIDDEEKKEMDMNHILEASINKNRGSEDKSIDIQTNFSVLPTVSIAPMQMTEAFREMIANAAASIEEKGIISIASLYEPPYITVNISDTGAGISSENLNRIFDPYYTGKTKARGLGLAFVKAVIKNNNGTVEASSRRGEGTSIVIKIPETLSNA